MPHGAITGYIDVAQIVLYAFWIFFAGLVFYLRREDRREGYPLESEVAGGLKDPGFLLIPTPKMFQMADGKQVFAPRAEALSTDMKARKREIWPGSPIEPTGDLFRDGVGPGGYAHRSDTPDLTWDGHNRIVPLRIATDFVVAAQDPQPGGMAAVGADGLVADTVTDLWIDRGESLPRYYEVELAGSADRVLVPVTFARISGGRQTVSTEAILAGQFAAVPRTKSPDEITMLEEEKIVAFFGAGTLYATPGRTETLL